jgi:hypothetical protein
VGEELTVAHAEGVRDAVTQTVADSDGECDTHPEALVEGQGVAELGTLALPLAVLDCEPQGDSDGDLLLLTEAVAQLVAVRDGDGEGELHAVGEELTVVHAEGELHEVGEELAVTHAEGVRDAVTQPVADSDGECDTLPEALVEGQGVAEPGALALPLGVPDGEALGEDKKDALLLPDGEAQAVRDDKGDRVAVVE